MKTFLSFALLFGLLNTVLFADVGDYFSDAISRNTWTATSSHNSGNAHKAYDNDLASRWTSNESRTAGMWFKIDFGQVEEIDALFLDIHTSLKDWPSGYSLELSVDNSNWLEVTNATYEEANAQAALGELYIPFAWAHQARYIRMTLAESTNRNWSIHEAYVSQGSISTNYPPYVEVNDYQVIPANGGTAILSGTYIDDGLGGGPLSINWTKVSGDGNVSFQNGNSLNATATFSIAGNYSLKLTVSDGSLSGESSTIVYVYQEPSNIPRASNPFIKHMFTADPSAHVWADGRLYVYPSQDNSPPQNNNLMDGYHVFSTDDMLTWTDHGEFLHSDDVPWGLPEGGFMWAPDCAYRNGTYYFYFPHPSTSDRSTSWKIGVATSSSPTNNFVLQGYIEGLEPLIDPSVFIDDDNQPYLIHGGGGKCMIGKLKENMIEIDGAMTDITSELIGFHEGPWMFKRNQYYYMIYPDFNSPNNQMVYAISTSVMGPWDYKGLCIEQTDEHTMHGSIVEFNGKWWAFYHNKTLSGVGALRSSCFDEVFFNQDGTIQLIQKTIDPMLGVDWPSVCEDADLDGELIQLPLGDYTTTDLTVKGISNNVISSIYIPEGYEVELYANDNFQGTKWIVDANDRNLSVLGADNAVSSIKVKLVSAAVKIEAESGTLNICTVSNDADASGGSYVRSFNQDGASITFNNIDCQVGGDFYLNFTYGCGKGTVVGLKVNDSFVDNLICRNTETDDNYVGNQRELITLNTGLNSIQLFMQPGSKTINPDYITLAPVSDGVIGASWTATASHNSGTAALAIDGDEGTRWGSGQSAFPGMWYKLDMGQVLNLSSFTLRFSNSPNDYPPGYNLEVSIDDSNWTSVATATKSETNTANASGLLVIPFTETAARYIRMTITDSDPSWWSIYEVEVESGSTQPPPPPPPGNLLVNGSFENGSTGWVHGDPLEEIVSTDTSSDGSYSLQITGSDGFAGVTRQLNDLSLQSNTDYVLSFDLNYVSGTGALVVRLNNANNGSHLKTVTSVPSNGWISHTVPFNSGALTSLRMDIYGDSWNGTAYLDNFSISAVGNSDPFEDWKAIHGVTDDLADNDGDGILNLMEFALGGDPLVEDHNRRPDINPNLGDVDFTFYRSETSLTYIVEKSADLTTWTTHVTDPGNVGENVTVSVSNSEMSNGKLFLRLRVSN